MGRPKSLIKRMCIIEGCGGPHYALNLCRRHYHQHRRAKLKEEKLNEDVLKR